MENVDASGVATQLQKALAAHQQGDLETAQTLYQRILQTDPRHCDALQLLATALTQQKKYEQALELFDQALAINPQLLQAHNNRASVLRSLKRLDESLASYTRALQLAPNDASVLYNHGNTLFDLHRFEEALASYDRALALKPADVQTWNSRGNALRELNRFDEALQSYDHALALAPNHADAWSSRGNVQRALGQYDQALQSCERALALKPNDAQMLNNQSVVLNELRRPDDALKKFDAVVQLDPTYADAWNNRGNALRLLSQHSQALQSYERALALKPNDTLTLNNQGVALHELLRFADALKSFEAALKIDPNCADAHWNGAVSHLLTGDFAQGWPAYEWRLKIKKLNIDTRHFQAPRWHGSEPLHNKTILLYAEQGLGDVIQFCRYAQQVAALGARVVLEVQPALKTLLANLAGVTTLISQGDALPAFDYHCPLLSLPLIFKTDLHSIKGASYIARDAHKVQAWRAQLQPSQRKKIGVVWSGNPKHTNDHNRSIALEQFQTIFDEQIDYYCLQKEIKPGDAARFKQTPHLHFVGEQLNDFSDTAALIELMDLVITIDTSVAHLAAAMGKPVWILLPFIPDWRWLLERSDSPWYDSVRLLRQTERGDWRDVLSRVRSAPVRRA